jgi:hypothetical protein
MLLQIMEEGRLTDSFGRHVDFKNTILIMTSNVGAERIMSQDGFGFQKRDEDIDYEKMKETLTERARKRHFRPEFINRLDEVIVFHKLTQADLAASSIWRSARWRSASGQARLELELTQDAKDFLLEKGPTRSSAPVRSAGPSQYDRGRRSARTSCGTSTRASTRFAWSCPVKATIRSSPSSRSKTNRPKRTHRRPRSRPNRRSAQRVIQGACNPGCV